MANAIQQSPSVARAAQSAPQNTAQSPDRAGNALKFPPKGPRLRLHRGDDVVRRRNIGEFVFHQGDESYGIVELLEGMLVLSQNCADGRSQIVDLIYPGQLVGFEVADEVRASSAKTQVPCQYRIWSQRTTSTSPILQRRIVSELSASARRQYDHIRLLNMKTANERLANFLLTQAERQRGAGTKEATLVLDLSRTDIGNFLGLRLETVSRGLLGLQRDRLIVFDGRRDVRILNLPALRCIAGKLSLN